MGYLPISVAVNYTAGFIARYWYSATMEAIARGGGDQNIGLVSIAVYLLFLLLGNAMLFSLTGNKRWYPVLLLISLGLGVLTDVVLWY